MDNEKPTCSSYENGKCGKDGVSIDICPKRLDIYCQLCKDKCLDQCDNTK